MKNETTSGTKSRIAFLLVLALAISVAFIWVIKDFLIALLLGAVFAGILYPFYSRLLNRLGNRKSLAAALSVVISLLVVIIPLLILAVVIAGEAVKVSASATDWLAEMQSTPGGLEERLEAIPELKKLLPYQEQIVAKASELTQKVGAWIGQSLAAGARGAASLFLSLFVMLFAMFYFLTDGRAILDGTLRYTPLSKNDQSRLLGTFVSVSRATLRGKLVIGVVQGSLAGLALWFAGIDGALFWSAVMAVLSIIPMVGAALVWVPAVIFLYLNGQTGAAIGVGLWCAVVVGMADNVLNPMLVGKDTEMPDILVMLTTLGGLTVFGTAGLVIGPIIGAVYVAVWKLWGSAVDDAERGDDPPLCEEAMAK